MPKSAAPSTLARIRANRRALRRRGLQATDILMLEAVAHTCGDGLKRFSVAALGRLVGVGRATALRHVRRLEAVGALIRFRSAIGLNVAGVLSWCEEACRDRAAALKRLFLLRKSKSVCTRPPYREKKVKKEPEGAVPVMDRLQALAELAETYVPVHLRRHREAEKGA